MDILTKKAVVAALNSLEVIESSGGEDAYILVENSKENHEILNAVGISSETINGYGDEETFCVLALGFGEGYVDLYEGSKLICFDERFEVELDEDEEKSVIFYKVDGDTSITLINGPMAYSMVLNDKQKRKIREILG